MLAATLATMAPTNRIPFQQATRTLLRDSVLGAMRDLLSVKDWSEVTMTDVAAGAGVSRQTVYNEFKSRQGLAQAYALQLADRFVGAIEDSIYGNAGRPHVALVEAFTTFFQQSASDPLVQSLLTGEAKPDLLRLITTDSAPLLDHASGRLAETLERSWIQASPDEAGILSRGIVRLAISYISMPPDSDRNVAEDLARIFVPFIEAIVGTTEA
ncbi:TetR/AcrR family transcriptional regulator [Rhodococcus maanshanensis]|uniref:DNA-binding transcriptional regulator, AcrR family n=1 Tax=Rhodococcus maanshanensis TaxID=183556 RepID=A0A1H7UES2_9NOCA|nr:TetR family transcriptional regulator [Rhodococcus maanshanensis]SEL95572.1 DNA-binding transcriptional regulator, AcrR family [Rhodococcus maanshanensis]